MKLTRPSRAVTIQIAIVVVVLVAAALSTKRVDIDEANAAAGDAFDPAAYAESRYDSVIVPAVTENAIELSSLLADLADLADGADEATLGNTPGTASSFSFPVTATGVVTEVDGSVATIAVEGVPSDVTVLVQIGPALNGTALRDVTGTISFDEFTNQLEYQRVGTAINDIVRTDVLSAVDPTQLDGATVDVVGAFTRVNPQLVSIVPISMEVTP
ncbi:DUF2291 family protein [Ilumatobacter coccineus]|uniref:DUF2291 domain-containing protein n=1 Tax=Ilumatobacter coccineus (strain NBRC 103263 / KCTC 29153 / YM16-304) TaxID=1313172 RepID=A0A6C7EFU6_ILUCY|nr:DUF2291 family protein [Ilumatobacter coccineus]BAN03488.1 hypothetical protein YM304_31740 [Ilumatobacter coccineus YM16-304]